MIQGNWSYFLYYSFTLENKNLMPNVGKELYFRITEWDLEVKGIFISFTFSYQAHTDVMSELTARSLFSLLSFWVSSSYSIMNACIRKQTTTPTPHTSHLGS